MAIALVAKSKASGHNSPLVTSAIDTTGANLLIAIVCDVNGSGQTVTDSFLNTWSKGTLFSSPSFAKVQVWYVVNPTVGALHVCTLTETSAPQGSVFFAAFSGVDTSSPFDVENGHGDDSGIGHIQPGSITPANNGSLLIIGDTSNSSVGAATITDGFAQQDFTNVSGSGGTYIIGGGWWFLVQSPATAINPTLTQSTNVNVCSITAFKPGNLTTNQTQTAKARVTASTTQTQPAKARITGSTTKTIPAKGNIQASSLQTQPAKGNIRASTSQTIPAKARLAKNVTQIQTAKANILAASTSQATIDAKARISLITSQTQTSLARVLKTITKTQPAKGNILGTTLKAQNSKAKIVPVIAQCTNFESFTLGQVNPGIANFVHDGSNVVSSGGPNTSTRFLLMVNSALVYQPGFWTGGLTFTCNWLYGSGHGFPDGGPVFIFRDTDGTSSHNVEVRVIGDGSFLLKLPDGTFSTVPLDTKSLHQNRWYWTQVNIQMVQNPVTRHVEADFSIYLDGETALSYSGVDTGLLTSQFFGTFFNEVHFATGGVSVGNGIDNLCLRGYTTSIIYPELGTPNVRVAQGFIEAELLPETSNVRVAQGFTEVIKLPTTSNLRVAQGFIELILLETPSTPQPIPDVPTPFLGRPSCTVQIIVEGIPTVVPVEGIPSPPVPPGPPTKTCVAQRIGQL